MTDGRMTRSISRDTATSAGRPKGRISRRRRETHSRTPRGVRGDFAAAPRLGFKHLEYLILNHATFTRSFPADVRRI
jgi:hypothetical protein